MSSKLVAMPRYPGDPAAELQGELQAIPANTPTAAVASELLSYFTSGGLAIGSRLPSERKLADMLGTGRSAVREALAALEILGIVEVRPGSGTYLRSDASELLPRTLSWGLMVGSQEVADLVEIRTSLEILAARLAAEHAREEDLRRIRGHLEEMARHVGLEDPQAFVEADAHFHQEIAAASQNTALAVVLQSVRALLRVWVDRSVDTAEHSCHARDEHSAVLEAIAGQDPQAAAEAMAAHMVTASERVLSAHARGQDG